MRPHLLLYVIVSISGAAVLAIEILGTRMLGPFYGVSLFLWSALITVTLAALSVGYALGGRWADKGPSYSRLAIMLGGAGIWFLLCPWFREPLLHRLDPLGLRSGVLLAATLFFFFPLLLLGMVGPYAIRLRATNLGEVGRTAGDIYAISTVASVAAALLTGFILIPHVGVSRLVLWVGVLLLAGAVLALVAARSSVRALAGGVVIIVLAMGVAGSLPLERANPHAGLLEIRQSPYSEIRVLDWEGMRMLLLDGGVHTITQPDTWRSGYQYVVVLDAVRNLFDEPGKLCLVGLGGGSVAKTYVHTGWDVDVVEIDPEIVAVARQYFGLTENEARIFLMDGRRYFRTTDETYDLVILDAFGSSSIPFHLVTRESFAGIKSRLQPNGILALNVESNGWYDTLVRSLTATLHTSFAHVIALPIAEPQNQFGNIIILASDRSFEMNEQLLGNPFDYLEDEYWHWVVVERNHAWANRFEPKTDGMPVLTDDRNPVDLWSDELNRIARLDLHASAHWGGLAY
jgi:spermidine synthase